MVKKNGRKNGHFGKMLVAHLLFITLADYFSYFKNITLFIFTFIFYLLPPHYSLITKKVPRERGEKRGQPWANKIKL